VHTAHLARADLTRRDGIPVTSLGRTILDLAVDSGERTVSRYIRKADEDKTFDLHAMEDLLARTKEHRGQAKVRAALEIYDETPIGPTIGSASNSTSTGRTGRGSPSRKTGNGTTSCCTPVSPAGAGHRAAARP
jgi:hypothetical protein